MLDLFRRTPKGYVDLTPAQVHERLQAREAVELVDVRSPGEFAKGHIPGALLMPLGELGSRAGELRTGTDIIVYCHSSARSRRAAERLAQLGYTGVYNMAGGIAAWSYGLER